MQLNIAFEYMAVYLDHRILEIRPGGIAGFSRINHTQRLPSFCLQLAAGVEQTLLGFGYLLFRQIFVQTDNQRHSVLSLHAIVYPLNSYYTFQCMLSSAVSICL